LPIAYNKIAKAMLAITLTQLRNKDFIFVYIFQDAIVLL